MSKRRNFPVNSSHHRQARAWRRAAPASWVIAVLLAGLFGCTDARAGQCDRWVTSNGLDSNPGTLPLPWLTVQYAADHAVAGETVCVGPGAFDSGSMIAIARSGDPGQAIGFTSPGRDTIVSGFELKQGASHLLIEGFRVQGFSVWGISLDGDNSHVTLSGLAVSGGEASLHFTLGASGQPPENGPVDEIVVQDSTFSGSEFTAVDCTPGPCNNMTFRNLEIHGAGIDAGFAGDALAVERGDSVRVEDCHIHDNGGDGIDLNSRDFFASRPVTGIVVRRNRVERSGRNGIKLWSGGEMVNNLVVDSGDTALIVESGTAEIINNTIANMVDTNYLAAFGFEGGSIALSLFNNIFSNDDPNMVGTSLWLSENTTLIADHNLYFNPFRDTDVICAQNLVPDRCFDSNDLNDGTWFALSGQGQSSRYSDPLYAGAENRRLTVLSPAVDAADPGRAPAEDLEQVPRGANPDIGAYELNLETIFADGFESGSGRGPGI